MFWDVKEPLNLSREALVEIILNRGDFEDFLKLIDIMGLKQVAEIFYRQASRPRKNYSKKTEHYFREFLERNLRNV